MRLGLFYKYELVQEVAIVLQVSANTYNAIVQTNNNIDSNVTQNTNKIQKNDKIRHQEGAYNYIYKETK